jgi:malate dehydrogenase (oxaloacetate-decarboxylating)(NADP+)
MKRAAVEAIAGLARAQASDIVRRAYGGAELRFGPEYLIPKPFDPRLMEHVAPAVARAAMESGVATRPIDDLRAYRQALHHKVFRTGMTMKPVFDEARARPKRVVFAEGEQDKVLQAAQQAVELGIARPILIGREARIVERIAALGLDIRPGEHFALLDPLANPNHDEHVAAFYQRAKRRGYSPAEADECVRGNGTSLACALLRTGGADALICGTVGRYQHHLERIEMILGRAEGVNRLTAMNAMVLQSRTLFIADTYVQVDPDAEALAEITALCADEVRHFGLVPQIALVSHSNFGSHDDPSARKMREALRFIHRARPDLDVDGEMRADAALSEEIRAERFPDCLLDGGANLLIMPNQDAANIAFNLLKVLGDGTAIGPILLGTARSAHIVTPSSSVRGLLNMTAFAGVRA